MIAWSPQITPATELFVDPGRCTATILRTVRCYGHILNLKVQAFLFGPSRQSGEVAKIEKTKIAKEDDQYKKSDYRIGERLQNEPTTKSVKVLPPERCPAPSGQSICQ
jgi:hypothetical protein